MPEKGSKGSSNSWLIIIIVIVVVLAALAFAFNPVSGGGTRIFGGADISYYDVNDIFEGGSDCSSIVDGGGRFGRIVVNKPPPKKGFYLKPMIEGSSTTKFESGKKIKIAYKEKPGSPNVNYMGVIDKVDEIDLAEAKEMYKSAINGPKTWEDFLDVAFSDELKEKFKTEPGSFVLKIEIKDITSPKD